MDLDHSYLEGGCDFPITARVEVCPGPMTEDSSAKIVTSLVKFSHIFELDLSNYLQKHCDNKIKTLLVKS